MITWGSFLEKLRQDGVTLDTCEEEAMTESGERITIQFLTRVVDGRYLSCIIEMADPNDPVPRRIQRQIANRLRLPVERYIFDER